MTFDEWYGEAFASYFQEPEHDQRFGQWLFNSLHKVNPVLAEKVRTGDVDPFYSDDKVALFLGFVAEHWND